MTSSRCRAYLRDLQIFGIKLGLETMRIVLASFGDPHRAYPTVHVAGTNGKGSVCAMLAEILAASGLKAGLYTSPHLVRVEERIRVGGRMIPARDFLRLAGTVKARIDRLLASGELEAQPTFFEVLTLIAFLHFREAGVDIAVIETGMGGRFDATNVVLPLVSVITSISRDHQEHLGGTLARIAFEKAGIIKPGVPVVCGAESKTAARVIRVRWAYKSMPMMVAKPQTLISTPVQRARVAGGKMSPMIACEIGIMAPAPRPWKARNMMSSVMLWLWPQSTEPVTNSAMPRMKKRLRP